METQVKAYMESNLQSNEITKEIIVAAFMNEYPEELLYDYPHFFLKKISKLTQPSENTMKAINDVKEFLGSYSEGTMNKSIVEKFFNIDSVTSELIGYVGW